MILLLGDDEDSTLDAVAERARRRGLSSLRLSSAALAQQLRVRDEINATGEVELEWTVGDMTVGDRDVSGVLNLLDELDYGPFEAVHRDDRLLSWRELRAYLVFALSRWPNVINRPAAGQLSAAPRSLCHQWTLAAAIYPQVAVPEWFFGHDEDAPATLAHRDTLVTADPFAAPTWDPRCFGLPQAERPHLLHELPPGARIRVLVLDEQAWVLSGGAVLPRGVTERARDVALRLAGALDVRWGSADLFHEPRSGRLTFGALARGAEACTLPPDVCADVADALLDALAPPAATGCNGGRRHSTKESVRVRRALAAQLVRRTPNGARVHAAARPRSPEITPPVEGGVLVIGSRRDATARHLYEFAKQAGVPVAWWLAEELLDLSAALAALARGSTPGFGVFYRRPGSDDPELARALCLVDDLLDAFGGVVVGNTYHRGSNTSKPLHTSVIAAHATAAVRAAPTVLSSIPPRGDEPVVVKAISSEKSEVLALSELPVPPGVQPVPVQFQQFVQGTNIRVHVCGGTALAVEITSPRLDYRFDPDFSVTPIRLPTAVEQWVTEIARTEDLEFAGVDLIRAGCAHYCLEVNPSPGYEVFEQRLVAAGHPPLLSQLLLDRLTGDVVIR